MSELRNQLIRKSELLERDITAMYQLMDSFYENITPKEFIRTLAQKDYIFLVKDNFDTIQAFTTFKLLHIPGRKQKIHGILAGDIITQKDFIEDRNIFREALMDYELMQKKKRERYLFLACKDYWTFKVFKESFCHTYPDEVEETPQQMKRLINLFGEYCFSQDYEAVTGLVKHSCFPRKIKENRLAVMEQGINGEEYSFFKQKNPEFKRGYDLLCVAELSDENSMISIQNINHVVKM